MKKLTTLFVESKSDTLKMMPVYFEEVMDKYLNKYMVNIKNFLAYPEFVVRSTNSMHAWYNQTRGEIGICYTDAVNGTPDLIKRLVYHEAIHYVQSSIGADRRDPHGEFFKKCMDEINTGEGRNFVTIKSPAIEYETKKPFRVVGFVTPGGKYYFGRVPREVNLDSDLETVKKFATARGSDKIFSFTYNSGYFEKSMPSVSGKSGGFAIFNETEDNKDRLADLMKTADANIIGK